MSHATILIICLVLFSAGVVGILAARPGFTAGRGGKILAFVAMFCLPIFCGLLGLSREMERSKTTAFCLSCHTMEDYGKSLLVDDPTHLPASHFQNRRVPADEACYSCHTQYAMFGGLKVKLYGLKHVFIYYFGTPPAPEDVKFTSRTTIENVCIVIWGLGRLKRERCTMPTRLRSPRSNPISFHAFPVVATTQPRSRAFERGKILEER